VLTQLGYYPLAFLGAAATQFASPIVFARAEREGTGSVGVSRDVNRLFFATLAGTSALVGAAVVAGGPALNLAAGSAYADIAYLMPIVVAAGGLYAAGQMAALQVLAGTSSGALVKVKAVTSSLYVVGVCAGAAVWGVAGVAVANLCFAATYCVWLRLITRTGAHVGAPPVA
jgi:hypothetical protein